MLLRHYEIRVDDVECLRLFNKSVRMCLQDNNKLKLTARFFASDDVVNFLPSFATGKDHRIIVTQFADDGSWNYNVVDQRASRKPTGFSPLVRRAIFSCMRNSSLLSMHLCG